MQYDLLPRCREDGGEVFSYPCSLMDKLDEYLPEGKSMMPYGYSDYAEYYMDMDRCAKAYLHDPKSIQLYAMFIREMHRMNMKENWSVLRYVGKSDDRIFGLTHGRCYYWPCKSSNPVYEGVIDDEEFTSYWYPTEASDWEILDDPTGMASRTILEKKKGYTDRKKYEYVMNQLKEKFKNEET